MFFSTSGSAHGSEIDIRNGDGGDTEGGSSAFQKQRRIECNRLFAYIYRSPCMAGCIGASTTVA